ncbi:unnamed protein product [Prunus armeniaca]|uniref:Uncharacterized protein n=1 Tax=Prunus armeniaca TaxID=36596 RepID=A0A6J5V514_PRUAR|nr:unnamed protein product [Prunus armeniaca]CAB4313323.1 unnamed protein product [Prunus armeniaca]
MKKTEGYLGREGESMHRLQFLRTWTSKNRLESQQQRLKLHLKHRQGKAGTDWDCQPTRPPYHTKYSETKHRDQI